MTFRQFEGKTIQKVFAIEDKNTVKAVAFIFTDGTTLDFSGLADRYENAELIVETDTTPEQIEKLYA